jgi:hypothetical protein
MTEPIVICPNCKTEIKLTESLAAPLIEATRQQYEKRISDKEAEVARREAAIAKAKEGIEEQVSEKLKAERIVIAAEEAKKAKLLIGTDLEQKAKEITELHEVLKQRDEKLAEAQTAQADGSGRVDPKTTRTRRCQTRDGPDYRKASARIAHDCPGQSQAGGRGRVKV